jgi:obg-like ATPase 1
LKDEESLNAAMKKTESLMRSDKKLKAEYVMQSTLVRFDTHSMAYFTFQDILCKIKTHLVDQAKHIRYGDWNVQEVRNCWNIIKLYTHKFALT